MTTDLPQEIPFPLEKQMLPVPGTKQPGFSSHLQERRSAEYKTTCTVYETLLRGKDENLKSEAAGWRPWNPVTKNFENHFEWYTYEEVEEERTAIGSGLGYLAKSGRLGSDVGPPSGPLVSGCSTVPSS